MRNAPWWKPALRRSLVLALIAPVAGAEVVERTYVGTFSNELSVSAGLPGNNPALIARGGKYVVKTRFDTDDMVALAAGSRFDITRPAYVVSLDGLPGSVNSYELFVPTQGFGTLTQSGRDHYALGTGYAATAEIQFFSPCGDAAGCDDVFRGFAFESNFMRSNSPDTPAAGGDLVFEQYTYDASFSGTPVTNYVVNVLDQDLAVIEANGGHVDVLSEDSGPAGGQRNPGVFFARAVEVVAEAGAAGLVYSHANLDVTTQAGTEQVFEAPQMAVPGQLRSGPSNIDAQPRQADNDLGAGRSDGEDFLTYEWTINGVSSEGDEAGTRINRSVETLAVANPSVEDHGPMFVNDGTRTVDDVNKTVAIQDSGLTRTTDVVSFELLVTEDLTGQQDGDTVLVSYANALPTILNFSTTVEGKGLLFELGIVDPDLAVNALIPDFEVLETVLSFDGHPLGAFGELLSSGSQFMSAAELIALFGVGERQLDVAVTDYYLRQLGLSVTGSVKFSVVPLPSSLFLLLGALGLAGLTVRRGARRVSANTGVEQSYV